MADDDLTKAAGDGAEGLEPPASHEGPAGENPGSPAAEEGGSRTFEIEGSEGEFKQRAYSGALLVFSWNFVNLAIAFVGNVVLARLLTPHDFGVVAIGATAMLIVGAVAEGGLGAGLMRRPEYPEPAELRTLAGLQFTLMFAAAAVIAICAFPFGTTGKVVALMVFAMPIASLQAPASVVFARNLNLRPLTTIEAAGIIANYTWSISAVLAGLGVWGLASGWLARAIVGTLVIPLLPGGRLYRPSFERIREFRAIVAFGIRFQANWVVIVLREQALNVITAAVAGVATLGLWSIANRLLMVPQALGNAVGSVAFPTMAHVVGKGEEAKPLIERTTRLTACASAILLAAFAASTPGLVPALFGEDWEDVVSVFPGASLGLMLLLPIASAAVSFLFAHDRPGVVLRASLAYGAGLVGASAALLPLVGVAGIGGGLLLASILECVVLATAVRKLTGARIIRLVLLPLLACVAGAAPGWAIAEARPDFVGGVIGGTVAPLITLVALFVLVRGDLADLASAGVKALRGMRRGAPAPAGQPE